jgi:hypothetical protein
MTIAAARALKAVLCPRGLRIYGDMKVRAKKP